MNFKNVRLAIAATSLVFLTGLQAQAESLADALVSAYRHSGLLEQNRALLRAADEDVATAVAALRPVVNYALTASRTRTSGLTPTVPGGPTVVDSTSRTVALTASLLLYDGGRTALRREAAKENVLALRESLRSIEQQILLRAVSAYMGVRRAEAMQALRRNNVKLIEQELKAARDRFEVGEVTRTDVSIAEARLASAQSAMAAAEGALEQAREEYRAAVGHYPGKLSQPPKPPATASSLSAARAVARRHHPDIMQAQHNVRLADISQTIARRAVIPTFSGSATIAEDLDGADTKSVSLSLSGPIYQGGALAAAARKAAAQADAARAGVHLATIGVDQAVGNAWAQMAVARAAETASDEQIRASEVAFRGVKEEADLGSRTTLDVLNAEQELLDARANKVSASSDRYVAAYNLLASMGLLTADHLKLGIALYDPAAYYNAVKSAPLHGVSPQGKKLDRVLKALGKK